MKVDSWKSTTLEELVDIKHGYAFKGTFFREIPPGDVLLTPGNFAVGGGFKDDKFKYYAGDVPQDFVLSEGDLLVTMTDLSKAGDTLGYPATVPKSPKHSRFLHNQRLGKVIIFPDAKLDKGFLYYLLRTRDYRNEVLASATGTTVKHTSPQRIKAFRFPLPPLGEQRAIARILGALDDKIELNRQTNQTLEAMASALFKSWFVDFDPVRAKKEGRQPAYMDAATAELFPHEFEESVLGEIPKGWRVGTLGEKCKITMGQSPPSSTYNESGSGTPFYQGRKDFGFRYPTARVYCTQPKRFAEKGDTLVSVRAPVGDINIANQNCSIGRGVAAVRHQTKSRSYTYYLLQALKNDFARYEAEGTVFGSINKNDFNSLTCVASSEEIVNKFEKVAFSLDQKIENNVEESQTLANIRDTLLPKLMSGEVRVNVAEKQIQEVK